MPWIILDILVLLVLLVVGSYNALVRLKVQSENVWAVPRHFRCALLCGLLLALWTVHVSPVLARELVIQGFYVELFVQPN